MLFEEAEEEFLYFSFDDNGKTISILENILNKERKFKRTILKNNILYIWHAFASLFFE